MNKTDSKVKVMFVVPDIVGFLGDAVNERQLAKALFKYVDLETYSATPLAGITMLINKIHVADVKNEVNLKFIFPFPGFPYSLGVLLMALYGFLLAIVACIRRPRIIYVRSSSLALPFIATKKLHRALVFVKIPAMHEDEIAEGKTLKVDLWLFKKFLNIIERYVILNADRILVLSPLLYVNLVRRRKVRNPNQPIITPPGVDLEKIENIKRGINAKNTRNETFTIGFVGQLAWWQGIQILARAIYVLYQKTRKKNIKLFIIGDGPLRTEIERICRKLDVNYAITGLVPHEEALKLMSTLDALVVPRLRTSSTEAIIPIKVIEAWALGVPVIITRHKVFQWFRLKDGEDVLFCEPYPGSLAEAICKMLRDPQLRIRMSSRGYELAKKFSYDAIVIRLLKAFKRA